MAEYVQRNQSITSKLNGQKNKPCDQNATQQNMTIRDKNVDRTLKDLGSTNCKNNVENKSNLDANCFSHDRCASKTVRFCNVCENENNFQCDDANDVRKTYSDEEIYAQSSDMENQTSDESFVRKCKSDSRIFSNKKSKKPTERRNSNEIENSTLFEKLKKFWKCAGKKLKRKKKPKKFLHCSDSKCSVNSKSNDESNGSYAESSDLEAAYCESMSDENECQSLLEEEICFVDGEEDIKQNRSSPATSECENNIESSDEEKEKKQPIECAGTEDVLKKKSHVNLVTPAKKAQNTSFKSLKNFWEPRNGLNDLEFANEKPEICVCNDADKNKVSSPIEPALCTPRNGLDQPDKIELDAQASTETLVASQDVVMSLPLPQQDSQCNGFLNYKTSPICCSLDSTSASCRESETDIKKTIRELKKDMALRKKMQKMELNQLKEEMRCLQRSRSRQKKSGSGSSRGSWSSATADCGSLSNLMEASRSSYSNPACSIVSFRSSNDCVRSTLRNHPCQSIPNTPPWPPCCDINYAQPSKQQSTCSQLKQQYSVNSPKWSEPVSRQQCPYNEQYAYKLPESSCYAPPKTFHKPPNGASSSCNFNLTGKKQQTASKILNGDSDPTNWLWEQLVDYIPCDSSARNESIITCYVNMYRKQAVAAGKRRQGCIDPLEFRYGYQNEKHANGPVNIFKKGDAKLLWSSNNYGNKRPKRKQESQEINQESKHDIKKVKEKPTFKTKCSRH